jgi:hypothetical protein
MSIETKIIYNKESQKTIIENHITDIQLNFQNGRDKDKEPLNNLNNILTKFINFINTNNLLLKINNISYSSSLNPDFFDTLKSSILEKRNEEYLEKLKIRDKVILFGIHFDGTDKTNVEYYLNNDNCLIIYNENFDQYDDKNNCEKGGGNGILRKYRSDSTNNCSTQNRGTTVKAFVYGIPTGPFDNAAETIKHQDSMNDSISQIIECINKNTKIDYVIWCIQKIEDTDYTTYNMTEPDINYKSKDIDTKTITLGLGIFGNCNKSVKAAKYISDILFKIFKTRQYYFSNRESKEREKKDEHKYFNKYFKDNYELDPDAIVLPSSS